MGHLWNVADGMSTVLGENRVVLLLCSPEIPHIYILCSWRHCRDAQILQNSRLLKADLKQGPYLALTIRHHRTNCSLPNDPSRGICEPLIESGPTLSMKCR